MLLKEMFSQTIKTFAIANCFQTHSQRLANGRRTTEHDLPEYISSCQTGARFVILARSGT